MSGIDDPGTPPELPEEYADTYRDAYRRALEDTGTGLLDEVAEPEEVLVPGPTGGSSLRWIAVAALAVLVLVAVAYGIGQLLGSSVDETPDSASTPSVQQSADDPPADPEPSEKSDGNPDQKSQPAAWDGEVVPVAPESAEATCTSDPGVDSSNDPVSYDVANTLDDDPTTAWRCDGSARNESITFTLPAGTEIGEVGLIPGYAKTDSRSGIDRYAENNRIARVTWTFDDGTEVTQDVDPNPEDREIQSIRVPRTATGTVTLTVVKVQKGPRNTTAISSVAFAAAES
ncbi:hypothetical protein ABIE44_002292 [Marmoricola sp. OAE513]|uniref:NADase-type glycan-binding domain-containing protein n=1 Tax=Marmoricola sp. OAE513 TaxID=2817894 RepID=UPI001AE1B50E